MEKTTYEVITYEDALFGVTHTVRALGQDVVVFYEDNGDTADDAHKWAQEKGWTPAK